MSRTKAEKRQQLSSDDEDEDVEQKDDDLELLMDEEERERFNQMSEKEREIEIFKRLEQREIMKTREQIKRKLEMAAGKGANERGRQKKKRRISADSDASDGEADDPTTKSRHKARATSDEEEEGELDQDTSEDETLAGDGGGDSSQKKKGKGTTSAAVKSEASESVFDAEYHKPSELANKQNKKKAMTDLLNKRREKKQAEETKKKEAQKAALDLDEIFGNDDKEDGKSMSSISSSTSSSRSSSPESNNKSRSPSPAVALPISTRPDLLKAQIIRRRLARIVHAPFFAKVAIGCFVRVQIGTNEGRPTYRIAQVMDVVETAKIYEVEPGTDIRTNKGFKLKISNNEPHRVIRLEFVSNGEFTDTEFAFWLKRMQETASPMPTMDFVERKGKEVRDALGYNYTDAEINLMVKEKQRFKRQPHNFAFQKAELLKQKEEAAQDGDTERMRDLQQQINDFEEKAKKIDYQRTKSLSAVTAINQRNREHMKQIFLGTDRQHSEAMQVKDDDPFTRKSARMKMVTGGRIKQETEEANSVTGIQQKTTVLSSSSTHAIGASALPASLSKTGGGDPGTSRRLSISSDLFSAHGIEINIDFGKMIPASSSSGFRAPPIGGINNSMLQQQQHPTSHHPLQQKPSTGSSRTLTLEEYKRKYSTRLT